MKFFIVQNNKVVNIILAESKESAEQLTGGVAHSFDDQEMTGVNIGWVYETPYGKWRNPISPYPSWSFNIETWAWEAPISKPEDNLEYNWDEATQSWLLIEETEEDQDAI